MKWEYRQALYRISKLSGSWKWDISGHEKDSYESVMNRFGENGWELVSIVSSSEVSGQFSGRTTHQYHVFKRQRQQ